MRSLNKLRGIRNLLLRARRHWLRLCHGAIIHPRAAISLSSTFVGGSPGAISIGECTTLAFKTLLLARTPDGQVHPIRIGRNCFVGGGAVILPGVIVGDGSIVGAGAIVDTDVPARCIVGGNPAIILRRDVDVLPYGALPISFATRTGDS